MAEAREANVKTESLDPVGRDIQLVEPGDVEQAAQRCLLLDSTSQQLHVPDLQRHGTHNMVSPPLAAWLLYTGLKEKKIMLAVESDAALSRYNQLSSH